MFFTLLIILREGSEWLLVYLILVAIMTDTFAMLIGSLIGKHKLIPSVSPNKSVEGSVAGSLIGTVVGSIFYYFVLTSNIKLIPLVLMTLVLTIAGQIGDLLLSKIKRENGIKDFSKIMPGHGGILDRLDSMCFIVITYAIIIGLSTLF
jgi:phosphatidate cytidylyltransferase